VLDAGQAAVDPKSVVFRVVQDVRAWHRRHPEDWRATRRLVKEEYSRFGGALRDRNGFELNTASVIAALLYGGGDYVRTSIAAFNFGWDADNNAATACTVVGVWKGARWMRSQGWNIRDAYRNTSRDRMPTDETITRFGDRLVALAERVILEHGGTRTAGGGPPLYRLRLEAPANLEPLADPAETGARLRQSRAAQIERDLVGGGSRQAQAAAAYQAICLDLAPSLRERHPGRWAEAIEALRGYPKVLAVLFFESDTPAGDRLRQRAIAAGLTRPERKVRIW
jgi:hypothetical protein